MARSEDHFSGVAETYAAYRPGYPDALFAWLAEQVPARGLAWDVGAGSGQASIGLAAHFEHVVATDMSPDLIERAPAHPRVAYVVGQAETSGLPEGSVDLVAVAQALHWFDLDAFYAEVRRVLAPGGLFAAWSYGILHLQGPEANHVFQTFYRNSVAPYWPAERRHVESGYRTLPFPFAEVPVPPFQMVARWPLAELLGYCRSWSAVARFRRARQTDPVLELEGALRQVWGDPQQRRTISWPLSIRAGRAPGPETPEAA